jgi:beta-glucosidase
VVGLIIPFGVSAGAASKPAEKTKYTCAWTSRRSQSMRPSVLAHEVLGHMTTWEKIEFLGLSKVHKDVVENQTPAFPKLCLASFKMRDGPNGLSAGARGVTVFPAELTLAATFDPALAFEYGQRLGEEARLQGDQAVQGPGVDVSVFANWGRNFENLGADPYLSGAMGAEMVRGIQSTGTVAVAKHLGPYAAEVSRNIVNYTASLRVLQEVYLAPFRAVVQAKVGALMCAVGHTNGVGTCANSEIMNLVHQWGLSGVIRTDEGAAKGEEVAALLAGVDLFKPLLPSQIIAAVRSGVIPIHVLDRADLAILQLMFTYHDVDHVRAADPMRPVNSKAAVKTSMQVADASQVLLVNNGVLPLSARDKHIAVFGALAQNTPLTEGGGSSQVVGRHVMTPLAGLRGDLKHAKITYDSGAVALRTIKPGKAHPEPGHPTILEARLQIPKKLHGLVDFRVRSHTAVEITTDGTPLLRVYSATLKYTYLIDSRVVSVHPGMSILVHWLSGPKAAKPTVYGGEVTPALVRAARMAKRAQVAIVVVGEKASEGIDSATLGLDGDQDQLVSAVEAANPHTVVVVQSGGPVLMPWLSDTSAVLESWYSGQVDGTAVAAVLTGRVDPSGHLPIAFPASNQASPMIPLGAWPGRITEINLDHMGLNIGEAWYDVRGITPLFPFGYGLTYTNWHLGQASVSNTLTGEQVTVPVTNRGPRTGRLVSQAYLSFPAGSGEPTRQLVGFGSVVLSPGQTSEAVISIPKAAFYTWEQSGWSTLSGAYTLHVGTSSEDTPLNMQLDAPAIGCVYSCRLP